MPDLVPAGARVRVGDINARAPYTVAYESITTTTAAITSTTPTAAITTDPLTFRNGRAYRVSYRGGMSSNNLGQQGSVLVTRGTATGPAILNSQRIQCADGQAGTVGFYFENVVVNNTGLDVVTALVGTYQMVYQTAGTNTGTVAVFGSSATPAYLEVVDIGPAADYPNATPL
ncbi:hypothetical protein ACIRQP_03375 [Streptomyces sp. NPDC102274]|uniref:hypothetical protein n=1 Tax=Streptomyces sp. NPDC102274 TaxID=3366151 RepID=UPI003827EF6F